MMDFWDLCLSSYSDLDPCDLTKSHNGTVKQSLTKDSHLQSKDPHFDLHLGSGDL